ncbi:hypothetical protein ACT453_04680, partial [Bacillus sp. D-CC]
FQYSTRFVKILCESHEIYINIIINNYKKVDKMEQQIVIKPYEKEHHNFDWLLKLGTVFAVFDQQDSGNISFGVEKNGHKKFIKYYHHKNLSLHSFSFRHMYGKKKWNLKIESVS